MSEAKETQDKKIVKPKAPRAKAAVQAVVVPVDNRNSAQRVQDACFEGLIRDYTAKQEWNVIEMINLLYGKVLSDRETPDV